VSSRQLEETAFFSDPLILPPDDGEAADESDGCGEDPLTGFGCCQASQVITAVRIATIAPIAAQSNFFISSLHAR